MRWGEQAIVSAERIHVAARPGRPLTYLELAWVGAISDIISEVDAFPWPTQHWCFVPVLQPGPRGGDPVIGDSHVRGGVR